jgi:hypothetical protein
MSSAFDLVPGEQIILQANLRKDKWKTYRYATCCCRYVSTIYGAPCGILYWLLGDSCRQEEADSFELVLTNQNLHFRQKLYQCGCCWQASGTKTIPLDRIQDIALVSDAVGDCFRVVDTPGEVYQLHVQTAASSSVIAELSVYCIENPREFKRRVLEAKNAISYTGQAKTGHSQEELARIIGLLERQIGQKPA